MIAAAGFTFAPLQLLPAAASALLYAGRVRTLRGTPRAVPGLRQGSFYGGVGLIVAVMVSPLSTLSDDLFWVHMVEHLLITDAGALLLALFVTWVATAQAIYIAAFGYQGATGIRDFVTHVLTTSEGWWLIVVGCGVGFLFALVALCVSVVSFPLMLDRHAGAGDAMVTSLRAVARNPVPMAIWGLIVAALLVAVSLPFFLGLAIVIPLLGHATWHLYRETIEAELNPQPLPPRAPRERKPAADFPANLFPWRRKDGA